MNADLLENGVIERPEDSVPHGGCISPLLTNLYVNEVAGQLVKRGTPAVTVETIISGTLCR